MSYSLNDAIGERRNCCVGSRVHACIVKVFAFIVNRTKGPRPLPRSCFSPPGESVLCVTRTAGVNDALLNARLRIDPNQQILPPITCGNQFAREILIESLRGGAFRSRDHYVRWRSCHGCILSIQLQVRQRGGRSKHCDPQLFQEASSEEKIIQHGRFLQLIYDTRR